MAVQLQKMILCRTGEKNAGAGFFTVGICRGHSSAESGRRRFRSSRSSIENFRIVMGNINGKFAREWKPA
jgi:hypothetical protein